MHLRLPAAVALLLGTLFVALPARAANRGIGHLVGDKQTTEITPGTDTDTFVFDAPAGGALTVTAKAAKGAALLPTIGLFRPSGDSVPTPELEAAKYAPGKSSVKVVNLPVDETGKWAAVIGNSGGGAGGTYTFQTKVKYPKAQKAKGVVIPQGAPYDIPVALATGCTLTLSVKRKSGGVLTVAPQVRQPTGGVVSIPGSAWTVSEKGISGKKIGIVSPFGAHVVRIQGPASGGDAIADIALSVAWPKRKPVSSVVSSAEPTINLVLPSSGNLGTQVSVTGTNFLAGVTVEVGGTAAGSVVRSPNGTSLSAVIPAGSGVADVAVFNPDGQSALKPAAFTYLPPPTVSSIVPATGPSTGGTPVTITGTNFRAGMKVYFGSTAVVGTVTVVNATTLTLTTETMPSGTYTVEVRDISGAFATLPGAFLFQRTLVPRPTAIATTLASVGRASAGVVFDADGDNRDDDILIVSPVEVAAETGLEPGTVLLRGNNALGLTDFSGGSFPQGFWPTIKNFDTSLDTLTDYGLAHDVAVGDLDGDGDDDAVLAFEGAFNMGTYFYFLYPSACGSTPVPSPYLGNYAYYPLIYPGTRIFLNAGSGTFAASTVVASTGGAVVAAWPVFTQGILWGERFHASAVAIADFDGDGDQDIALATNEGAFDVTALQVTVGPPGSCSLNRFTSTALRILSNAGNATFTFVMGLSGTVGEPFHGRALAAGDVNADGKIDLVVGTDVIPTMLVEGDPVPIFATRVVLNGGTDFAGDAAAMPALDNLDDGRCHDLALADVTGDGKLDIVITTPDPIEDVLAEPIVKKSSTRILVNNGSGNFTDQTATRMPAITDIERWQAHSISVGDIDGDGDRDMILVLDAAVPDAGAPGGYAPSLRILVNNGSGTFTASAAGFVPAVDLDAPLNATPDFRQGALVLLGDLDGDGDRDIFLGTETPVEDVPAEGSKTRSLRVIENR